MNELDKLRQQNALYEQLLHEIDMGIHVVDAAGKTILYNRKMMEIESMDSAEVLHKSPLEVFAFAENQSSTLIDALKHGKARRNIKQTYFNNKGKEITTINDTFPIMKDGRIQGAVEFVKDITQLQQRIQENMLQTRDTRFHFEHIIGRSEAVRSVIAEAKRASRTSSSVLLVGETGTGKEVFAQSIHNESARASKPFISQNCAAIPESLMESILFGTKKGAFTGAMDKPGLFEEANGGTLLLDEINSLSPHLQAKLLRVLQERTVRRIGSMQEKEVNVRIIATINEDPIEAIAAGRMRKDLYYRLSVVTLFLPPLRERKEDIDELVPYFIQKYNVLFGLHVRGIDEEVRRCFLLHDWPGNVRELEHIIEGAMNLAEGEDTLTPAHLSARFYRSLQDLPASIPPLPSQPPAMPEEEVPLKQRLGETEAQYIRQLLEEHNGNVSKTARALGMSRQSLQYRLKKYSL
ncbi:sigma-54 interaction domain-containing protein [Ectobacillus ponti]|uniref:Sigma 54-interacting transcriptional regulator n=1 Tax=Ectobacillus ponti TaxID=2961894 RepID=A0AA41X826_9BACI|nr:sigma 54-interacting transcriptional regulator [Ectobacillus ponti]MCP8968600.1 sigma 54-interacting transcriptional regulator [Ectobacillus ponti]